MLPSIRVGPIRMLITGALMFCAVQSTPSIALQAEEQKTCTLSFAPPEGTLLHYVNFTQMGRNLGGSDVTFNQTSEVDMSFAGKAEDGNCKVDLKFIKVKSSLVANNQLMDWAPPVKLEGVSVRVVVSPAAEIVSFEPGRNIPGLKDLNDLREVVDPWFVKLPDTTVTVGQSWKQEIVAGKKEGAEPAIKGEAVFTLKKIEKKGDLEIAIIEGKVNLKMNADQPGGVLVADGKADIKARIAVSGGYVIELKRDLEIRGNTVAKDPLTDKETKNETAITIHVEIKLQQ